MYFLRLVISLAILLISVPGCNTDEPLDGPIQKPEKLYRLPLVVHILHNGEDIGSGPNLSVEQIQRQVEILNEDFRRKSDTRGFNDHPDSRDSQIEFALAKQDQNGNLTDGIVRIDISDSSLPELGYNQNHYSQFSYWNPANYINIWVTPLPSETECLVLGMASGPKSDLLGSEFLQLPGPDDAEGILINWMHFGESDIPCHARFGRTLTHEMGHYLGLLHPWGANDCVLNDFCKDTPAVDTPVFGLTTFVGCSGELIMIGNYMNFSEDEVMNIFTNDQIDRMQYVLDRSENRKSLVNSKSLIEP